MFDQLLLRRMSNSDSDMAESVIPSSLTNVQGEIVPPVQVVPHVQVDHDQFPDPNVPLDDEMAQVLKKTRQRVAAAKRLRKIDAELGVMYESMGCFLIKREQDREDDDENNRKGGGGAGGSRRRMAV